MREWQNIIIHTYINTYIYMYVYTYIYTYLNLYISVFIKMYMYIYIFIFKNVLELFSRLLCFQCQFLRQDLFSVLCCHHSDMVTPAVISGYSESIPLPNRGSPLPFGGCRSGDWQRLGRFPSGYQSIVGVK